MPTPNPSPGVDARPEKGRLDSLLASSPAMLYVRRADGDGAFTFVSESVQRQLGYDPALILNSPQFWIDRMHPDDRANWPQYWKMLHRDGDLHAEYRIRHFSGPYLWVRDESQLVFDSKGYAREVAGYWADISRQKYAEELREKSEERLELITRTTSDALWDWNLQTNEMWWNEAYHTLFGIDPRQEGSGILAWSHRLHPSDRDRVWKALCRAIETNARTTVERYRFRRGDGTYAEVLARGHVLQDSEGKAVRMVGALVDVTEQMELQQNLFQSQKMEAIGRVAGGIAHDFNNILTAIMGYSAMLSAELSPEHPGYGDAEEIRRAAERAAALTRQLLAFSRRQTVEPRVLNLNRVVAELQPMLGRLLGERIEVSLHFDSVSAPILADPSQIEQILLNLSVNARDAMPNGGWLKIQTSIVKLTGENSPRGGEASPGTFVVLEVMDAGVGMSEEIRERLFEPFFTTKELGKGTGLGLATCQTIAKQLHGFIRVESQPGEGSTFRVFFPKSVDPLKQTAPIPTIKMAAGGSENILVVEDEEAVRELIAEILMKQGYTVWTAQNGAHAQKMFREKLRLEKIDLLVTDVVMPEMDGLELAHWLREICPETRVIFCSGYMDHGHDGGNTTPPGTAFLQKPFAPMTLASKVREVLDQSPRR
jgi:PAS domain S-box-containing protein